MREDGFYWVCDAGNWVVAEYTNAQHHPWFIPGEDRAFGEHYWNEIDERRITRGEATQVALPPKMPLKPYQTINLGSKDYAAGWNACRRAMLAAAPNPDSDAVE